MSELLTISRELQEAAASEGFDWPDVAPLWDKIAEELGELREAVEQAQGAARRQDELGDLLFVIVNLARHLQVDPAAALAGANDKFRRRYGHVMAQAATLPPRGSAERLDRMEALWQEAKRLGL